jgi:hypothetical protein
MKTIFLIFFPAGGNEYCIGKFDLVRVKNLNVSNATMQEMKQARKLIFRIFQEKTKNTI